MKSEKRIVKSTKRKSRLRDFSFCLVAPKKISPVKLIYCKASHYVPMWRQKEPETKNNVPTDFNPMSVVEKNPKKNRQRSKKNHSVDHPPEQSSQAVLKKPPTQGIQPTVPVSSPPLKEHTQTGREIITTAKNDIMVILPVGYFVSDPPKAGASQKG